jgi:2-oxoglutarate dehydrogenase E2 component (dihydrolipoamide succinyltransferase)
MPNIEMLMPKMGESIMEATVLTWLKKVGDTVQIDESILEVATDKIDTEVPASHTGILQKILVKEGQVAEIGKPVCILAVTEAHLGLVPSPSQNGATTTEAIAPAQADLTPIVKAVQHIPLQKSAERFYSPLVLKIAHAESISQAVLDKLEGSGLHGRVTKDDLLLFVANGKTLKTTAKSAAKTSNVKVEPDDLVIPMDRMRSMIAERMRSSLDISAHVTSFVDCDMSHIVNWRNSVKAWFSATYNENITYTPILIQAVARTLEAYPMMNIQIDGTNIVKKANINIGMAVALPNGNLVVPNIHNANKLNLVQLTKYVNDLTRRGRENKLKPEDLEGGTFTVSNIGTFGNIMGTPIILQPQVGILAFGAIVKTPAVIETDAGDSIAIRHKMYISHSYDHRVVDGSLGGQFLKKVADLLEKFDGDKELANS